MITPLLAGSVRRLTKGCPGFNTIGGLVTLYGVTPDNSVQPVPPVKSGSDFAQLSRQIISAGLMARRPGYYMMRIGTLAILLAAAWATFLRKTCRWARSCETSAI